MSLENRQFITFPIRFGPNNNRLAETLLVVKWKLNRIFFEWTNGPIQIVSTAYRWTIKIRSLVRLFVHCYLAIMILIVMKAGIHLKKIIMKNISPTIVIVHSNSGGNIFSAMNAHIQIIFLYICVCVPVYVSNVLCLTIFPSFITHGNRYEWQTLIVCVFSHLCYQIFPFYW